MSWSISLVGKPENVAKAIENESRRLTGNCKTEFDAAKPHLIGLVLQNFVDPTYEAMGKCTSPIIKLSASGSGNVVTERDTTEFPEGPGNKIERVVSRNCTVLIESFYSKLV